MDLGALNDSLNWLSHAIAITSIVGGAWSWLRRRGFRRRVQKFFGGSHVTIALPMRELENRRVVAEPDLIATSLLSEFLRKAGIHVELDYVNPDGSVDLTIDGLVVICGPKTSTMVYDAMQHDPTLTFHKKGGRWVISDTIKNQDYVSPIDDGDPASDTAYLARAVRREGSTQTFISIAGIHAQGSALAVSHLTNKRNFRALERATRGKLFSAAISGEFSDEPLRPVETHELAMHTHKPPVTGPPSGVVKPAVPREIN